MQVQTAQQVNHVSEDTAYYVYNYPYAFGKFCTIRYWVETKSAYGQRLMTQILDPLTGQWFKAKTDGYFDVCIITTIVNPGFPNHGWAVPVQVSLQQLSLEHLLIFSTYYTFTPHQKFVVMNALARNGIHRMPEWNNALTIDLSVVQRSENPVKLGAQRLTDEIGIPIESQHAADKRERRERREKWPSAGKQREPQTDADKDDTTGMTPEQLAVYNMAMGRD